MNPETGHLIDTIGTAAEDLARLQQIGYVEIPPQLNRAARRALAGKKETTISLTSGGKLSRFAAEKRKQRRKLAKQRRKQANESRRKNRRR